MGELSTEPRTDEKVREAGGRPAAMGLDDPYYISAAAPLAGERDRVLNQDDTFAVFDHHGDIRPVGMKEQGLFHEGTRFLSCLSLRLGRGDPMFLSSTVKEDNAVLTVDLTNPDIRTGDHVELARGIVHLFRSVFLWGGACYQRLRLRNYGLAPVSVPFALRFDADFADIFEVRGTHRARRGRNLEPVIEPAAVVLGYQGLDGVVRRARLEFDPPPDRLTGTDAHFAPSLGPQEERMFYLTVSCEIGEPGTARPLAYSPALARASGRLRALKARACHVRTSNERFNAWLTRSRADLDMLVADTPDGLYPYAGVPWFSTPFGRDGIITALETLWANPDVARGVLAYLAATQADSDQPDRDAQPGKILHETRKGEMAALREIPFGRYYGSVDSTPLFVMLAAAYFDRTGDRDFAGQLWPHVERALGWIDGPGDRDGDGFVEYFRLSRDGLAQQGWKDSHDSVFHADGHLAEGPIALCEVQGYVYAAKLGAARVAAALGRADRAAELTGQSEKLRDQFERAFWLDDLGTYALALDGAKRPCRVRTSNPGHCLYAGLASPERAGRVADTLLDERSFSGWGVRTVATGEPRYNPMSYHDGSVWPHDNALVGAGLARYRHKDEVVKILAGLFDASQYMDLQRMPELFCGFPRRPGEGPTLYPVACSPQAWAAGSVFLLLQACLGLEIDGAAGRANFHHPVLPAFLREVWIDGLRVGDGSVDLVLTRRGEDVGLNVVGRSGRVEVMVVK
jgi:glycogen debranching enzyme